MAHPSSSPRLRRATGGKALLWREVRDGLSRRPPALPPKLLYDARGARLFEEITRLPEYYPTRTEVGILREHLPEMAALAGPEALVLEPGSGSGEKTRLLLQALNRPVAYVPVDIAELQLAGFARQVRADHPGLEVLPVVADYTRPFPVPEPTQGPRRTLAFFPGSTVGNLDPDEAEDFLRLLRVAAGPGGGLLVGIDLVKDQRTLEAAYNDPGGVTEAFNLNVLHHLNRVLGSDFDPDGFEHRAPWIPEHRRIEMRLVARRAQAVTLPPVEPEEDPFGLELQEGDYLVTEHSNKFTLSGFRELAERSGWRTERSWTDPDDWFALVFLEAPGPGS
jgi:dimethylhistidine N-methyltransferase